MAMYAAPVLKRKGAEAPEPCLLNGVPVPATKIRRLDAEVPPVEPGVGMPPVEPGAGVPPPPLFGVEEVPMSGDVVPPVVAVGVAPAANEERAIVVYQPAEAARSLLHGPLRPGVHLRVNPDWIHGLKSTMLQEASNRRVLFEELASMDENPNLAMVPWAPADAQAAATTTVPAAETMDADQDGDGASMDVEQDGGSQLSPTGVAMQGEAFHHQQQWPPQHCMVPQQLPASSYQPSPVTWLW
uniref:Uncharacterized protein n=1 Tax=Arundo donax TaxID=35708 RepID=A0A0A9DJ87_ARUDO